MAQREEIEATAASRKAVPAKWFYGVDESKETFQKYVSTKYTYEKLISIHPVELKDIAEEAVRVAKKLKVELPDYFEAMAEDPMFYAQEALNLGIEPDFSDVTKLNEEKGTSYRNMIEYMQEIRRYVKPAVVRDLSSDPLSVIASEDDAVSDEESYLKSLL